MDKKITTPYESVYIDANDSLELPDKTAISGRLEQFLYALCSLDYENLPMPMSRIEMFANALITDEVPDIEPKSRSEQFFLAILTGNTDDLPEAKSRSEVLLRKIATNEYDLSDVEPIQSRYELLLAYLIQNNTLNISNLVGDIEYVMYGFSDNETVKTLTNTVEFPIKDIILDGDISTDTLILTTSNGDNSKSNVLTINEHIRLQQIGDIKDELNLSTGKLTQRIDDDGTVLPQEIIRMVDLSIINQDGELIDTLNTFDDVTYLRIEPLNSNVSIKMNVARYLFYKNSVISDGWKTIQNTMEYPVKNAILKGNTLVNCIIDSSKNGYGALAPSIIIEDEGWLTAVASSSNIHFELPMYNLNIKPSTKYLFVIECESNSYQESNTLHHNLNMANTYEAEVDSPWVENLQIKKLPVGISTYILTTKSDFSILNDPVGCRSYVGVGTGTTKFRYMIIEYQEGMENWDIPYFEGMKSVQTPVLTTTGKNLFNPCVSEPYNMVPYSDMDGSLVGIIPVKPNTTYTLSVDKDATKGRFVAKMSPRLLTEREAPSLVQSSVYNYLRVNYANGRKFEYTLIDHSLTFTTLPDCHYIYVNVDRSHGTVARDEILVFDKMSLVETPTVTPYEPYKSTTVTCNEEVELRGIGDVKDELDLMTGELTERIKTTTLDKFTLWNKHPNVSEGFNHFTVYVNDISTTPYVLLCDSLPVVKNMDVYNGTSEGLYYNGNKYLHITIKTDKLSTNDTAGLTQYLKDNIITIQYPLESESIKTVDISVVNQDGNKANLSSFENITHVTVTSEEIPCGSEMRIAKYPYYMDYPLDNSFDTIYNTMEYPVKSAILKGQTLVNTITNVEGQYSWVTVDNVTFTHVKDSPGFSFINYNCSLKPNTKYFIRFEYDYVSNEILRFQFGFRTNLGGWDSYGVTSTKGVNKATLTTNGTSNNLSVIIMSGQTLESASFGKLMIIEYQEGMENWDIPYFEGIQSVKMPVLTTTGKNLLNEKTMTIGYISSTGEETYDRANAKYEYTRISPNTTYYGYNFGYVKQIQISWYDSNKTFLNRVSCQNGASVISPSNAYYARVHGQFFEHNQEGNDFSMVQMMFSTEPVSSYEPFKSNILTVNEEVELRGIGDVRDELNLKTGELTQRIGEVVLNGSEKNWGTSGLSNQNETIIFQMNTGINTHIPHPEPNSLPISPEMRSNNDASTDLEGILTCQGTDGHGFYVRINRNRLETEDVLGFKTWLSKNPLTVRYQLETESIKTVDLHIINQDGDATSRLHTFNDITHIESSSLGLPPQADLKVVSLNQDDIENMESMVLTINRNHSTQNELIESVNVQGDDIDYTMMATTEIYENIL